MDFVKMHGSGNDYVLINCMYQEPELDPARLAELISNRHFGVGSDGVVVIRPSENAEFRMEVFGPDGSRLPASGTGQMCLGKYVYEHGLTNSTKFPVETDAGIRNMELNVKNDKVLLSSVEIGVAQVSPAAGYELVAYEERMLNTLTVDLGVLNRIIFTESVDALGLSKLGPYMESLPSLPIRANVQAIQIMDTENIRSRVWEKGNGETMASGTGAAAALAAAYHMGMVGTTVKVHYPGGAVTVEMDAEGILRVTGPATEVFSGEFIL